MVRPKSSVPTYRKQRGGQARVTINNRDYYLGPYGTKASKLEYDRIVSEYLASGRSSSFGSDADQITMAVVMADYLAYAKKYYGTELSSEWHRIKLAIKPIKALYVAMPAADFGPVQFKAVRQSLITAGGARTTINAHMKRIVRMFKWAAAEGKLPASVHGTLTLISSLRRGRTEAKETEPVKPVAEEVIDATLGQPKMSLQTLFDSERFPNIVVTKRGTVVAVFGNHRVRARRSKGGAARAAVRPGAWKSPLRTRVLRAAESRLMRLPRTYLYSSKTTTLRHRLHFIEVMMTQ